MKTQIEHITPEKARKYLDGNYGNRLIRNTWVENLAGMILRGEWVATHQGLAFAKDGRLLDGQHRLHAIVRAGKAVDILVTHDLDEAVFRHIDGGRTRTPADRVKLVEDEKENVVCVGMVRSYLTAAVVKSSNTITMDLIDNNFLTMADAFAAVAAEFRNRKGAQRTLMQGTVGAGIAVYLHHHEKPGRRFLEAFVSGKDLGEKSPVLVLREALLSGRIAASSHESYWKTIMATKAHQEGRDMVNLPAASEDWNGNKYVSLIYQHKRMAKQVSATKQGAKLKALG